MVNLMAMLVVLALAVTSTFAAEAELVVAKTILTRNPAAHQDMMVSIRIFNVGTGYDHCDG